MCCHLPAHQGACHAATVFIRKNKGAYKGLPTWHECGPSTRKLLLAQDFATFARVSGYVEQFDIHSPQATVKEALWFSARLRLTNDIGNSELWAFIRQARTLTVAHDLLE